ncbi:Endonuclease/exonuclease/phosphatase [Dillenia turbinata]|uniref:Endonuclease/exonuclease/phosphatase n=1 Tax=Dillenia turbinata TaxID=194707 RepID=A0AAN8YYV9_9MAGN
MFGKRCFSYVKTVASVTKPFISNPGKTLHVQIQPKSMSWTCTRCTFLNPSSQSSTCEICFNPSSSTHSSESKWSCKACTFLNPCKNSNCEMCGTRASALMLEEFDLSDTDGDLSDSAVGSIFLPLRACKRKKFDSTVDDDGVEIGGCRGAKSKNKNMALSGATDVETTLSSVKILSYNVWFREDLEIFERMRAIGELIKLHSPDVICLQEVTPNIYEIFQQSSWWQSYRCSVSSEMAKTRRYFCMQLSKLPVKSFNNKPFHNSIMGRELCITEVEVQDEKPLVVATSHLESPCPAPPTWNQRYSKERVEQAKGVVTLLKKYPNVIFGGDMNWDDKLDGDFPLSDGWVDAWIALRPEENGWTYDTKSNQMLSGNYPLQKRLDRFVCCFRDFKITEIDMIGTEAIQGLSYSKEKKVKREVKKLILPVLPSDHYGLLLTICKK